VIWCKATREEGRAIKGKNPVEMADTKNRGGTVQIAGRTVAVGAGGGRGGEGKEKKKKKVGILSRGCKGIQARKKRWKCNY